MCIFFITLKRIASVFWKLKNKNIVTSHSQCFKFYRFLCLNPGSSFPLDTLFEYNVYFNGAGKYFNTNKIEFIVANNPQLFGNFLHSLK